MRKAKGRGAKHPKRNTKVISSPNDYETLKKAARQARVPENSLSRISSTGEFFGASKSFQKRPPEDGIMSIIDASFMVSGPRGEGCWCRRCARNSVKVGMGGG